MAKGTVTSTNKPENKGTIKASINGQDELFNYNVQAGHTEGGYTPKEGDKVDFVPGNGSVATNVKRDVILPPDAVIKADRLEVRAGETFNLYYFCDREAKSAEIQPTIGRVNPGEGSVATAIRETTIFRLNVINSDDTPDTSSCTVFVVN